MNLLFFFFFFLSLPKGPLPNYFSLSGKIASQHMVMIKTDVLIFLPALNIARSALLLPSLFARRSAELSGMLAWLHICSSHSCCTVLSRNAATINTSPGKPK